MAGYSSTKSYLGKKLMSAVSFTHQFPKARHIPSDMTTEDNSNGTEELGFNVIDVRKTTATKEKPTDKPTWNPSNFFLIPCKETQNP
jgi:hypothetical protein